MDYNLGVKHVLNGRYNHNYATQISIAGQVPSYETIFNWARGQSRHRCRTPTPSRRRW